MVNWPVELNPVIVHRPEFTPGIMNKGVQSRKGGRGLGGGGIVEMPEYVPGIPFVVSNAGLMELNAIVPRSTAVPVTRFSVSVEFRLRVPETGIDVPRIPVIGPRTLLSSQCIVATSYVVTMNIEPSTDVRSIGIPNGLK